MSLFSAYFTTLIAGYLIGSVSFAVIIAKVHGVDIFTLGSGNPGATNILRNLGKKAGYLCFLLDALKGAGAAYVGFWIARESGQSGQALAICGLIAAIAGHSLSLFLKFRGGKGVATTIGGLMVAMPVVILIGILIWLILFYSTKYVSLASIGLGISLPLSSFFYYGLSLPFYVSLFLGIVILVRHRANIARLRAGTENRAGTKK